MRISDWSSDVCSSDLMLVFQVDLFPARGERPRDLEEAWSREKEIRFSSRTRRISDGLVRRRKEHRLIEKMLARLPGGARDLPEVKAVERMVDCKADRQSTRLNSSH